MKFIKEIGEGEPWTAAFIGWRRVDYVNPEDGQVMNGLKLSLNFGALLIKIEFIKV